MIRTTLGMLSTITTIAVLSTAALPAVMAQPSAATQEKPNLPTVVLVGDSIRLSYAPRVAKQLEGKANVASPKANGGDSGNVLKNLKAWVLDAKPEVVHFNCGIHDTKKFTETGKFQVSPEQYEANLRQIVEQIRKQTDAVVIFATTTPIIDDRAANARRGRNYQLLDASVQQYNTIALRVMRELNVPINDLHAALAKPQGSVEAGKLIGGDGVHLTAAGQAVLAEQISAVVSKQLAPSERSRK